MSLAALAGLAVLASLAVADVPSAQAIVNGQPAAKPWSVVISGFPSVVVDPKTGRPTVYPNAGMCSGSLIAERWVLTAAHCVRAQVIEARPQRGRASRMRQYDETYPASMFKVTFGASSTLPPRSTLKVAKVVAKTPTEGPKVGLRDDIALLQLATPAPRGTAPLPVVQSAATAPAGVPLRIYGYGALTAPGRRLTATRPGDWTLASSCAIARSTCYHPADGATSHPGPVDSGGSAVITARGSDIQVGLNTAGGTDPTEAAATQYGASVLQHLEWILNETRGDITRARPNTLLSDTVTGKLWLVDDSGFRRAVPTPEIASCLAARIGPGSPTSPALLRTLPEDKTTPAACSTPSPPPLPQASPLTPARGAPGTTGQMQQPSPCPTSATAAGGGYTRADVADATGRRWNSEAITTKIDEQGRWGEGSGLARFVIPVGDTDSQRPKQGTYQVTMSCHDGAGRVTHTYASHDFVIDDVVRTVRLSSTAPSRTDQLTLTPDRGCQPGAPGLLDGGGVIVVLDSPQNNYRYTQRVNSVPTWGPVSIGLNHPAGRYTVHVSCHYGQNGVGTTYAPESFTLAP